MNWRDFSAIVKATRVAALVVSLLYLVFLDPLLYTTIFNN